MQRVGQFVEVPDEVLEDQPHLLVRHRVRVQVHVAELGDDEIENVRLAQPTDLVIELEPAKTPHQFHEVFEKDHGRLEVRRCHVFDQLGYLRAPERWPDLKSFARVTIERTIKGQTAVDRRFYVSSLVPDAPRMNEDQIRKWELLRIAVMQTTARA